MQGINSSNCPDGDFLLYCVKGGKKTLDNLNNFLTREIGRGIEADDFCRFISKFGNKGASTLILSKGTAPIKTIIDFVKSSGTSFSAEALLASSEAYEYCLSSLYAIYREGGLKILFDSALWNGNADQLEILSQAPLVLKTGSKPLALACQQNLREQEQKSVLRITPTTQRNPVIQPLLPSLPTVHEEDLRTQLEAGRSNPLLLMQLGKEILEPINMVVLQSLQSITTANAADVPVRSMSKYLDKFQEASAIVRHYTGQDTPQGILAEKTEIAPVKKKRWYTADISWTGRIKSAKVAPINDEDGILHPNSPNL